jgi:4-amino-4-deoxy-L-arabinose transferase-like glycosyltransferase
MVKSRNIEVAFIITIIVLGIFIMYEASKTAFLGEDEATYTFAGEHFSKSVYEPFDRAGKPNLEPTFIPFFYGFLFLIFGASLSIAKIATAFFGMLTLLIVYLIGRKINIYAGIFAVSLMLLINIFIQMSMLAYVDVPTAFFSALILYLATDLDSRKKSVVLGTIMGLAYFVKVSEFFVTSIVMLYALYLFIFKKDKEQLKLTLLAFVISIAIIVPLIIRNLIIYNYPFFIVTDMLVPVKSYAMGWTGAGAASSTPLISLDYFISAFGWIPFIAVIFGSVYILSNLGKNSRMIELSTAFFLIFLFMFLTLYSLGKVIAEDRYLLIVFPQLALMGGYFFYKLKEKNKYSLLILVPLIVFSLYTSVSMALATSQSVRFPSDYVQALEWVNKNTPKDALIFTTYSGSVRNYADRGDIWTMITEFDKIMTTDNATYINSILKKYNVSYVVIWRGVVAESYYIPHANLAGVFSYQFVKTTLNANNSFSIVYQNQDNVVLKVI